MASSIYQRSVGPDLDSLIAWAQSLLPAKPAAADATKKAKANWAATPKTERRALALLFLEGRPPVQPTASQPEKANSRGQPDLPLRELSFGQANSPATPLSDKVIPTALPVADEDKAIGPKAMQSVAGQGAA